MAGASGRFGDIFDPNTGKVQGRVALASKAELDAAVQVALEAQAGWSQVNPQRRARVMFEFKRLVEARTQELAELLSSEHGKVVADSKGDVQRGELRRGGGAALRPPLRQRRGDLHPVRPGGARLRGLDMLVQRRRNAAAALKLLRRLLKNQGIAPETVVTDGLRSYDAAMGQLGIKERHRPGRLRDNNRIENSHLPLRRRERMMQRFLATHAAIANAHNHQRHLISRPTRRRFRSDAAAVWANATAAA